MFGSWKIDIEKGKYPQRVASALGQLDSLLGAEYTPIAYLGSQQVNGVNHAVLAEQLVLAGRDQKNVVLIIFHEGSDGAVSVANIERLVESGPPLGGIAINVQTDIPAEARKAFDTTFDGFVGSKVEPVALLGSQVTKGTNYIFMAKMTPVVANPEETAVLVTVNTLANTVSFVDILTSKHDVMNLGYAFTWLTRQSSSVSKTMNEWV